MKRISFGQFLLLLVLAVIVVGDSYLMVVHYRNLIQAGRKENASHLAAKPYSNTIKNDTSRYDYYGNEISQTGASQYVLPENARTKAADPKAPLHSKSKVLRKRNQGTY